jgi:hypothetical protein
MNIVLRHRKWSVFVASIIEIDQHTIPSEGQKYHEPTCNAPAVEGLRRVTYLCCSLIPRYAVSMPVGTVAPRHHVDCVPCVIDGLDKVYCVKTCSSRQSAHASRVREGCCHRLCLLLCEALLPMCTSIRRWAACMIGTRETPGEEDGGGGTGAFAQTPGLG